MSFIQIIEYETERAADIDAAMRQAMQRNAGRPGFTRLEHTQDHNNPKHYMTIVEFPSYEEAMENSGRPETHQMAQEMAAMCTSGPTYHDLDVKIHAP
ncbi:MAG TPA: hypothetical protein VF163_07735 [Micromonosporaceae bacterium]